MRKFVVFLVLLWSVLGMFTACSNGEKQENPGQQAEDEGKGQEDYYPFTGLVADGGVNQRAIAVMVNNQEQARPQTGLSKADIVFEMLTEGNITRFMAIYQSELPDVVGPVRSARESFFELANSYDALYLYSGAANVVFRKLAASGVDYLSGEEYEGGEKLFVREPFRKAPHNLYVQFGEIKGIAEQKGYDLTADYDPLIFLQEGETVAGDEDGTYAKINYYSSKPVVEFDYDKASGKYVRLNDGEKTIELESEKPIQVANVFIIEADHEVKDKEQRRDIDLTSGGKAYLLQHGKAQTLEWENRAGRIVPVKDGQVVPFVPGQTWINVVQTVPEPGVDKQVQIGR